MNSSETTEENKSKSSKNDAPVKIVRSRSSVKMRLIEIYRYRELLMGMIKKELKVKYKNSILGFFWTMLNPALYTVIFWLVFTKFLPNGIPQFVIFFLSGLLVWNLFTNSVTGATGSVVNNAAIVKKVYFPREILPLSNVGASVVHYFLQSIVLVSSLVLFRHNIEWSLVWLIPIALVALVIFSAAMGIFFSALNVYLRDTQHMLELLLLAWFWATPVVYPFSDVVNRGGLIAKLFQFNPITMIIVPFQRIIYTQTEVHQAGVKTPRQLLPVESGLWYLRNISAVLALSIILFYISIRIFDRAQGNFAEEL